MIEGFRLAPWMPKGPGQPIEPQFVLGPSGLPPGITAMNIPVDGHDIPVTDYDDDLNEESQDAQGSAMPRQAEDPPEDQPRVIRRKIGHETAPQAIGIREVALRESMSIRAVTAVKTRDGQTIEVCPNDELEE